MARIRSDILYKRKIKEVEEGQKRAQRLHIAPLILNTNQESDNLEEENESVYEDDEEDLNVSDSEDDDSENNDSDEEKETKDDFHWSEICTNWINLVDPENQLKIIIY